MNHDTTDEQVLLCVLYARALQRRGEGFPLTEEAIRAHEASFSTSRDEQDQFSNKLESILDAALSEAEQGREEQRPGESVAGVLGMDSQRTERYAARDARGKRLSSDLEAEIDRLIDEEEGDQSGGRSN